MVFVRVLHEHWFSLIFGGTKVIGQNYDWKENWDSQQVIFVIGKCSKCVAIYCSSFFWQNYDNYVLSP